MNTYRLADKMNGGYWLMILGCPLPEKHDLKDPAAGLSGPSFATCGLCEHQIGKGFELENWDGYLNAAELFPEHLACALGAELKHCPL